MISESLFTHPSGIIKGNKKIKKQKKKAKGVVCCIVDIIFFLAMRIQRKFGTPR